MRQTAPWRSAEDWVRRSAHLRPCRLLLAAVVAADTTLPVSAVHGSVDAVAAEERPFEFKVLVAGPPRTGTESLHRALLLLGYNSLHTVLPTYYTNHTYDLPWSRFALGMANFSSALQTLVDGRWDAAGDQPHCFAYSEILKHFPRARVVLSVRDNPEVWFLGMYTLVRHFHRIWAPMRRACSSKCRFFHKHFHSGGAQFLDGLWDVVFPSNLMWPLWQADWFSIQTWSLHESSTAAYTRFIREVIHEVPSQQLLIYNARDGWLPLCRFLGHPVPEVPFPSGSHSRVAMEWDWRLEAAFAEILQVLDYSLPPCLCLAALLGLRWFQQLCRWAWATWGRRNEDCGAVFPQLMPRSRTVAPPFPCFLFVAAIVPVAALGLAAADASRSGGLAGMLKFWLWRVLVQTQSLQSAVVG